MPRAVGFSFLFRLQKTTKLILTYQRQIYSNAFIGFSFHYYRGSVSGQTTSHKAFLSKVSFSYHLSRLFPPLPARAVGDILN